MKIVRTLTIILVIIIAATSLFLGSCAAREEQVDIITTTAEPAEDGSALLSNTEVAVTATPGQGEGVDHTGFLVGEFLDSTGGTIRFNGYGAFSMESYTGRVFDGSYTLTEYPDQTILTLTVDHIVTSYTYSVAAGYGAFCLTDANEDIIFFTPVCYD